MRIREYTPADFDSLRRMHAAQGFSYPLPDLESPLFVSKLVLQADEDQECAEGGREVEPENFPRPPGERDSSQTSPPRIAMAILQRLTAETYLLHDPAAGTPKLRWQQFLVLHEAARRAAVDRGLDDVQAFLPPQVARAFGRRLRRLGWNRDPWDCFTLRIE